MHTESLRKSLEGSISYYDFLLSNKEHLINALRCAIFLNRDGRTLKREYQEARSVRRKLIRDLNKGVA
jgi:hypothetical protein